jgi:hypothetical protein
VGGVAGYDKSGNADPQEFTIGLRFCAMRLVAESSEKLSAALVDIVVEITGHGKIISIINTKNHDMLLRRRPIV